MKKEPTPKQQAFLDFYLGEARGNATEAARLAKYKGNDHTLQIVGSENLLKPVILKAIAEARERIAVRTENTHDSILAEMDNAIALAIKHKHSSAAIRGIELKGKQIGMFPNRIEGNVTHEITLQDAAVSELDSFFTEADQQSGIVPKVGKDRPILPH